MKKDLKMLRDFTMQLKNYPPHFKTQPRVIPFHFAIIFLTPLNHHRHTLQIYFWSSVLSWHQGICSPRNIGLFVVADGFTKRTKFCFSRK